MSYRFLTKQSDVSHLILSSDFSLSQTPKELANEFGSEAIIWEGRDASRITVTDTLGRSGNHYDTRRLEQGSFDI